MESPIDGIVYYNPALGQPLFVQDNDGEMANCGQVTGCEYRVVMRGAIGSVGTRHDDLREDYGLSGRLPGVPSHRRSCA